MLICPFISSSLIPSRTYLAHHELESDFYIIIIVIIISLISARIMKQVEHHAAGM